MAGVVGEISVVKGNKEHIGSQGPGMTSGLGGRGDLRS